MLTTLTPTHPFFDLTRERSRSYLTWARRLAQAEAFFLLLGSCALLDSGASSHQINPFAIAAAVMGILWLTLGYYVGRGSARAAVILLGLSIARQVMVFMPEVSAVGNVFAPLILLDLFLFTQAARGAVALSRTATANPFAEPVVAKPSRPVAVAEGVRAPGFKWPVEWSESPATDSASIWAPNFTLDFIVASTLVAVSMAWLDLAASAGPDNSGVGGLAVLFDIVCAMFHLAVATALFAGAYGAEKGKSWAGRARAVAYVALLLEALSLLQLQIRR